MTASQFSPVAPWSRRELTTLRWIYWAVLPISVCGLVAMKFLPASNRDLRLIVLVTVLAAVADLLAPILIVRRIGFTWLWQLRWGFLGFFGLAVFNEWRHFRPPLTADSLAVECCLIFMSSLSGATLLYLYPRLRWAQRSPVQPAEE